ncbi:2176_t:CDS:2, partial [Cetraspora pellucida]
MNTLGSPSQYHVNDNKSVNLPFGCANIKAGLITLKCVEGAINYLSWKTIQGQNKLMNRLDEIIELTDKCCEQVAKIKQRIHRSQHMPIVSQLKVLRINLSFQAHDHTIMTHCIYHSSGVEIALKLLAPYNNTNQLVTTELKEQEKVLYYQYHDTSISENCPEHYYQLTVIIENEAGYGSPLAFGLSNKENYYTIQIAVQVVQANILSIMDKCQLTKLALQGFIHGNILSLAFKIVGRSRSNEEAIMIEAYNYQESTSSSKNVNNLILTATYQNYGDNAHDNNFEVGINISHS